MEVIPVNIDLVSTVLNCILWQVSETSFGLKHMLSFVSYLKVENYCLLHTNMHILCNKRI